MCGVVGVINVPDAYSVVMAMSNALQYRGENGAGLVLARFNGETFYERTEFTVPDLEVKIKSSKFQPQDHRFYCGLGHTRYGTFGDPRSFSNAHPLGFEMPWGWLYLVHNGDSPYADEDRQSLKDQGIALSTNSDSEIILHQMGLARTEDLLTALRKGLQAYRGTYALCMLTYYKGEIILVAIRDPSGNRPLSLGRLGGGYVVASENSAFEVVDASYERDIRPGEILIISPGSISSHLVLDENKTKPLFQCIYEDVYFSIPSSIVFGIPVHEFRKELGRRLAKHFGHLIKPGDIITNIPDSSNSFAEGFCQTLHREPTTILIRRHSVGRSFTKESQVVIDDTLRIKFSFFRSVIKNILNQNPNARFWIIEDSIVRGNTIRKIIRVLRSFGVKFIGVLSGAPPLLGDCGKGINMRGMKDNKLIAAKYVISGLSVDSKSIAAETEANFIGYQPLADLYDTVRYFGKDPGDFCYGCFENREPIWGKW